MKAIRHLIATLVFAPFTALHAADGAKPNIVFVIADDPGWGQISCHGAEHWLQTPHVNRLAHEGMDSQQFNALNGGVCGGGHGGRPHASLPAVVEVARNA